MDQQTKTALKHDKFVDTTNQGIEWASENRKAVIVTASLLLLAILIVVVGLVIYDKRSAAASEAFGAAMQEYQTPVALPGQTVPPGIKTYPSIAARAKAANTLFMAAANKYSMTSVGKNCLYFGGLTYMEAGENSQAEATFKKVADSWNKNLSSLAKLSLAQLYQSTGRSSQAISLYQELASKPTTAVPAGEAQLQLAQLYTNEGKTDEAKKIYAQLKDKDAKGAAGQIAAEKLNGSPASGLPR